MICVWSWEMKNRSSDTDVGYTLRAVLGQVVSNPP